jgi:hypothetical protein
MDFPILKNLVGADYVVRAEFSCNVTMYLTTKGLSSVVAYGVRSNLPTYFLRGHIQH